jgi:hypothetical protein
VRREGPVKDSLSTVLGVMGVGEMGVLRCEERGPWHSSVPQPVGFRPWHGA